MKTKRILTQLISAALLCSAALFTAACDVSTSDNGRLDGFWHIEQIDTLATGGTLDVSRQKLFWASQHHLMMLVERTYTASQPELICHFEHDGQQLRLYDIHYNLRDLQDPLLDDVADATPYGVNRLDESYIVEQLTGSKMVLRSSTLRLTFRKM